MSASAAKSLSSVPDIDTVAKREMSFQLIDSGLAFVPWLIAVFGIGFSVVIAYNLGNWSTSFWLGLLTLVVGLPALYLVWFAHGLAMRALGFGLTLVTVIIITVVIVLIVNSVHIVWAQFAWGLLVAVLLAVVYAAIKLYGRLTSKAAFKAAPNR